VNRTFGIITMAAGVALSIAELAYVLLADPRQPGDPITTGHTISAVFFLLGAVLLTIASVGMYQFHAGKAGKFGMLAFMVAGMGSALMVAMDWMDLFIPDTLTTLAASLDTADTRFMIGAILPFFGYVIGWLLFGISSLFARVFPRIPSLFLIVCPIGALFLSDAADSNKLIELAIWLPWYVSYIWMGAVMFRSAKPEVEKHRAIPAMA
jgi:uncharacterized membrane protein